VLKGMIDKDIVYKYIKELISYLENVSLYIKIH